MEARMSCAWPTRREVLLAGLAAATFAPAADASEQRYTLRLIAGAPRGAPLRAGIDIELAPGWKTYWRMPGEAGVPPQFDWSGSQNAKSVEVLWPSPTRFSDAGGETVGYKDRVVFPLRIPAEHPSEAVLLRLSMFFGVCKEVCIPVDAHAELSSWQVDPTTEALLTQFEDRVPERADQSSLHVASASVTVIGGKPALRLAFAGSPPDDLDIFIESNDTTYFPAPRHAGPAIYIVDGPPNLGRLKGKTLKLTMVGSKGALEQDIIVD
jgi:DsbC/DsbD-like thiol-disulfide interchange protein